VGILAGLFLLLMALLFLVALAKTATSYLAIRRPPITCPACGKNTHVFGRRSTCSRCGARLVRLPDGSWAEKEKP
jgi:ribosomal protein S27E